MFDIVVLSRAERGATRSAVEQVGPERLPSGELEIEVSYSTLPLRDSVEAACRLLAGGVRGRLIVDVSA